MEGRVRGKRRKSGVGGGRILQGQFKTPAGLWWGSPCVGVPLGFLYGVSAVRPPATRARLGLAVESGRAALISSLSTPSSNSRYGTPPAQQDTRDSNTAAHPFLQHTYTRIGTSSRGGQRLGGGRQSGRAPVESRGQAQAERRTSAGRGHRRLPGRERNAAGFE